MHYTNLVLGIPHAVGTPQDIAWGDHPKAVEAANRWTDWFTDELFAVRHPRVTVVTTTMSRLDCDVERLEHEPDRICRVCSLYGEDPEKTVSAESWNRRLAAWFRYRADLMLAAAGAMPLIIDCHSFPSDLADDVDICLGFNEDASKPSEETLTRVAETFRSAGYAVAFNRPYANAIAPLGYRGHSLMIEVNKRTYLDERKLEKSAGFMKLQATIRRVYRSLL